MYIIEDALTNKKVFGHTKYLHYLELSSFSLLVQNFEIKREIFQVSSLNMMRIISYVRKVHLPPSYVCRYWVFSEIFPASEVKM